MFTPNQNTSRIGSMIWTALLSVAFAFNVSAYAQETSKIEVFAVQPGKLDNLANVLGQLFDANSGVRISTDRQTSQIIVSAPEPVQQQIGKFIQQSGYLQDSPQARVEVPAAKPAVKPVPKNVTSIGNGLVEVEVKLANIDAKTLEGGIVKLVGQQVPVSYTAEGALVMLTLPTNTDDQKVGLQVYRAENRVIVRGSRDAAQSWSEVIRAMDTPSRSESFRTSLVSLRNASRDNVEKALTPLKDAENSLAKRHVFEALRDVATQKKLRWSGDMAAMIFQPEAEPDAGPDLQAGDDAVVEAQVVPEGGNPQFTISPEDDGGLIGPVQIEFLEGLDVIVVRGHRRDVERITNIINDIERLSVETQPLIEVRELLHANSEAVAATVNEVYENLLNARYGQVSITALNKPNAILLIGREQSVDGILELIEKLDQPVGPAKTVRAFQLKHVSANEAATKLTEFYTDPTGLGTRIRATADIRSNAVIIQASPRDMLEIEYLLDQIDVSQSKSTLKLEVVQLKNSLAEDLAPVLQEAITGATTTTQNNQTAAEVRQAMLSFMTLDASGKRILQSGILTEVQITADARSNALIVRAPQESMELVLALVKHLDSQPSAESQIKVFTIINGDATQLTNMLGELFQTSASQNNGNQNFFAPQASSTGESSLIPLNFSVDTRTNSIIASGSASDLTVVEAILLRLDQDDVSERKSTVVRLRNARADLVAQALSDLLASESQLQTIDPSVVSPFQQIVREVIVVPEPFSNSLIISATAEYFDEVLQIVMELDARPPMVLMQVLIADVRLGDLEELGFEFGLQDAFLFDRSTVVNGELDPGFNFNNQPLGNSSSATSLATAPTVATQGLTNFALGRVNNTFGYGGFVFSAASESVNILVRALEIESRLEVLARPEIMTMDNQPGFIQVGERVPFITSSQLTVNGTVNTTELINTGIILSVTPRISPDGMVVMAIQAERSAVGDESDGIPISINQNGDVIRSPKIDTQTATAVVSARSGQTIVFGGLINDSTLVVDRQVPVLGDIPLLGRLFSYETYDKNRSELLIIITPIVVRNDEDAAMVRDQEMSRMSWCLADVAELYGNNAFAGVETGLPLGAEVLEIYPDDQPAAMPEVISPGYQSPALPPNRAVVPVPATSLPPAPMTNNGALQPTNIESATAETVRPVMYQQYPQAYRQPPVGQQQQPPMNQQFMAPPVAGRQQPNYSAR